MPHYGEPTATSLEKTRGALFKLAHSQNSNGRATLCGAADRLQFRCEVVDSRAWRRDFDAKRGVGLPEFIRVKQAVGIGVREDGHAFHLARKFELEISLGSKRGPNGQFAHELRGPSRFKTLGDANMFGDGREAQGALAGGPDRAACFGNIGLASSARVEKRQLHRDDLARRRLDRGDHASVRFSLRLVAIAGQKADRGGRRLVETALAKIGFGGSAGDGLRAAPKGEGVRAGGLWRCAPGR